MPVVLTSREEQHSDSVKKGIRSLHTLKNTGFGSIIYRTYLKYDILAMAFKQVRI